ncbi:MAG: hypothetical protein H6821_13185 [Planctomycetaceae bacterium]|nr:hypothetical protein [Planctomycetaceae bacterium]
MINHPLDRLWCYSRSERGVFFRVAARRKPAATGGHAVRSWRAAVGDTKSLATSSPVSTLLDAIVDNVPLAFEQIGTPPSLVTVRIRSSVGR